MRIKYNLKRLQDFGKALLIDRRTLKARERWSRQELLSFQNRQLTALAKHAARESPFYRELYRNINTDRRINIEELPIIDKEIMMKNFDRFVTDPRLELDNIKGHIEELTGDQYFLDEYRVLTTGGTSGLKGIFAFNREEWTTAIAGVLRWNRFMDIYPSFPRRLKISSIGAGNPLHATSRMAISSDIGVHKLQMLKAIDSIDSLVHALNSFRPEVLNSYPSIASLLALEQLEGRLDIHPRAVSTLSEVRTKGMEENIREAWGIIPYDYYGMTEVIAIGSECSFHQGIHVFEDLCILEVVDEDNKPVPEGSSGHKLLITNLYNFTQPIIRYEVSDMLTMSEVKCSCGFPFRLIARVEGRNDDVLHLRGKERNEVLVHPRHFRSALDDFDRVKKYQVIHEEDGLHIRLVLTEGTSGKDINHKVKEKVKDNLESLGVEYPVIFIHIVDNIEQDPDQMGKLKLIQSNVGD